MRSWIQKNLADPQRARAALCVFALALGSAGFALVMAGILLSR